MPPTAQTINSTIGLEVTGMTADQFAAPHAAHDEHGVVVHREAHLSDDAATLLTARAVDPAGGDTEFANDTMVAMNAKVDWLIEQILVS